MEWKYAKYPIMPLRTFRSRSNIAVLALSCFHSTALTGGTYFLPLYFQGVLGASPLKSGIYLIPLVLSLSIVSASTGLLIRRSGKYLVVMRISALLMALGFGLFIDLPTIYTWAKLILYQLVAGLGLGPNFQAPLVALQAMTPQANHAAASATFNLLRNLSASIAIVASTAIFQNAMQRQHSTLVAELGDEIAGLLTGANAATSVEAVARLAEGPRVVAQKAFADGLRGMWILFVVCGGLAFLCSLLVGERVLDEKHVVTVTGLAAEEEKRALQRAEAMPGRD
jgi:hypothetical protein